MQDAFYDALAPYNHLLFENWERFQSWQLEKLSAYLPPPDPRVRIVDCASGIGTQLVPFAAAGYSVCGVDSSPLCVERARRELSTRGLDVPVRLGDLRRLADDPNWQAGRHDLALLMDNYITHAADDSEVHAVLAAMHAALKPGGTALLGVRDYDQSDSPRPTGTAPAFYVDGVHRRIVHQVWDWRDASTYDFHLHFAVNNGEEAWVTHHFVGRYRPMRRATLADAAGVAGFRRVEWIAPARTGYHQWVLRAQT